MDVPGAHGRFCCAERRARVRFRTLEGAWSRAVSPHNAPIRGKSLGNWISLAVRAAPFVNGGYWRDSCVEAQPLFNVRRVPTSDYGTHCELTIMPTILFVEDDRLTRESIAARFSRRGLDVIEAQSGEEALELAGSHPELAAALLDYSLPGIDGVETFRRLREADPEIPVVFCSGHMNEGIRQKLSGMGIPERFLLNKPCRFQELLNTVTLAMRKSNGQTGDPPAK